jgi:putative heme-binding domain-containing protein
VSSTVEYPYCADKSRWSDDKGTRVKGSRDAIKILEDTDGDGKADKVTDFANELNIPTGVLPWHKPEHKAGCIAWSIPNIWYFADTDGDDKADVREVLFGPLGYEKDTHGMCSSFRLGLDGWVYATHGFNNTSKFKVRRPTEHAEDTEKKKSDSVHSVSSVGTSELELHSGNVFRFRPDGSAVERYTSGQVNPFGLCWDRYSNLYSADCHSSPIYQLIRGACYPSFGKPHDGLGFAPVMCEHTHGSTGICGIVYIDGGVWGPEWDDHTFVGNVVTSKVNHDHVTFTGSTPKANEQPDFLTSDDPWFRPVDLQLGPDNALYIADFYNKIIGHYEVPLDHKGRDKTRGRIWRVVKKNMDALPRLSDLKPDQLVKELNSPNLTRRWLATQLLPAQLSDTNKLQSLLKDACTTDLAIAHVMWVDETHSQTHGEPLNFETKLTGDISRTHWARRWATKENVDGKFPFLWLLNALGEENAPSPPQVQRAVVDAFTSFSGRNASDGALTLAAYLKIISSNDTSLRHAIEVSMRDLLSNENVFKEAAKSFDGQDPAEMAENNQLWEKQCLALPHAAAAKWLFTFDSALSQEPAARASRFTHIARHGDPSLLPQAIALAKGSAVPLVASVPSVPSTALPLLTALHDGLSERGTPPPPELLSWAQDLAKQLLEADSQKPAPTWTSTGNAKWSLQPRKLADGTEVTVLQSMAKGGGDEESRTGTLKSKTFDAPAKLTLWLNGHRGFRTAKPHDKNLVRVVEAETNRELARAFPPRDDTPKRIELNLSKHAHKRVRLEIIDGDSGKAYAWLGLTRIEPAVVSVNDFQSEDSTRESLKTLATMLQHSAPAALREKLATYHPPRPAPPPLPVSPEQRKHLDTLIAARVAAFAKAKPDLETGANVFKMNCAACHQIKGEGGLIGPQLDGIGARGPARLCEDILDPNRNVDAHFHLHTFTMKDDSVMAGFLKAELGQMNVIADATGKEHRVSKQDIVKTSVSPISLMPPTFGQTMDEATFIDLLGYLLNEKAAK